MQKLQKMLYLNFNKFIFVLRENLSKKGHFPFCLKIKWNMLISGMLFLYFEEFDTAAQISSSAFGKINPDSSQEPAILVLVVVSVRRRLESSNVAGKCFNGM